MFEPVPRDRALADLGLPVVRRALGLRVVADDRCVGRLEDLLRGIYPLDVEADGVLVVDRNPPADHARPLGLLGVGPGHLGRRHRPGGRHVDGRDPGQPVAVVEIGGTDIGHVAVGIHVFEARRHRHHLGELEQARVPAMQDLGVDRIGRVLLELQPVARRHLAPAVIAVGEILRGLVLQDVVARQ